MRRLRAAGIALAAAAASCGGEPPPPGTAVLRVGHFPNVTHAHGLVAHGRSRAGRGWFEERLGPGTRVEWSVFNAGPSAMEAVFAGSLDLAYVGPSPALNAHARSGGAEVRVLAGATRGGSALVVRGGAGIAKPAELRGKRVATPELGNTQDVACRVWLMDHGFRVTTTGGDVLVLPVENPDQLTLFQNRELDAAWTVEPWVSRLELDAEGRVLVEEKDALTTVLVASARVLAEKPDLVRKFVAAHRDLTAWLRDHPAEAKAEASAEIAVETKREMAPALLDRCWPRMRYDDAVAPADFEAFVKAAVRAGTLPESPDTSRLVQVVR